MLRKNKILLLALITNHKALLDAELAKILEDVSCNEEFVKMNLEDNESDHLYESDDEIRGSRDEENENELLQNTKNSNKELENVYTTADKHIIHGQNSSKISPSPVV